MNAGYVGFQLCSDDQKLNSHHLNFDTVAMDEVYDDLSYDPSLHYSM